MKNIKKLLALALVLVLAIGMVPMAGAADISDFPDADLIENQNEAGLITTLGVMVGRANGEFDPTGVLTRAEAAIVLTRLVLGPDLAAIYERARVDTGFRDVTRSHWASGAIAFCYEQGWIVGVGNNRFGHADPLTIPAFATMLMRALGLATADDFQGANWIGNVIMAATGAGVLTSEGVDFTGPATRDLTAKIAFDALFSGAETIVTGTVYKVMVYNKKDLAPSTATSIHGDKFPTFLEAHTVAEKLNTGLYVVSLDDEENLAHGSWTIVREEVKETKGGLADTVFKMTAEFVYDDFMRPATVYNRDGRAIYFSVAAPVKTYTAAVSQATLYSDLGLTGNITAASQRATLSINGGAASAIAVARGAGASIGGVASVDSNVGNGVITEVYRVGSNFEIVQINVYVGEVKDVVAATAAADRKIQITVHTGSAPFEYETDSFAKGDIFLYTYAALEIQDIWPATSVMGAEIATTSGTVRDTDWTTAYNSGSFVSGDQTYRFNRISKSNGSLRGQTAVTHDIFLDDNNYVVYAREAQGAAPNFLYLDAVDAGNMNGFTGNRSARVVLADGTVDVVTVRRAGLNPIATDTDLTGFVYAYTLRDNVYLLSPVAELTNLTHASATSHPTITAGTVSFGDHFGTNNTTYVIVSSIGGLGAVSANAYTGVANLPLVGTNSSLAYVHDSNTGSIAVMFIVGTEQTSSGSVVVLNGGRTVVTAGGFTWFEYVAFINGERTTIRSWTDDLTDAKDIDRYTGAFGNGTLDLDAGGYAQATRTGVNRNTLSTITGIEQVRVAPSNGVMVTLNEENKQIVPMTPNTVKVITLTYNTDAKTWAINENATLANIVAGDLVMVDYVPLTNIASTIYCFKSIRINYAHLATPTAAAGPVASLTSEASPTGLEDEEIATFSSITSHTNYTASATWTGLDDDEEFQTTKPAVHEITLTANVGYTFFGSDINLTTLKDIVGTLGGALTVDNRGYDLVIKITYTITS